MNQRLPDEIVEAYAFANTPAYLYRKLIGSEYVSKLMKHEQGELVQLVNLATAKSVESIALAYAALLALLRKNINKATAIELATANKLEWAPALIRLYEQKAVSVSRTNVRPPKIFTGPRDLPVMGITQSSTSVMKVPKC